MVSLFMGHVAWGGTPADEKVVRATQTPVDITKPAAVSDDMPVMQEYESDSDPNLGMVNRTLASSWHEGRRATPFQIPRVDAITESQAAINRQVSSSGTAARREASGVVAKNASYAVGIEPVQALNGGAFGNEYFVRDHRDIQETSDNTMMTVPPGYDHQNTGDITAAGKAQARESATAGLYNAFWNGGK